MNLINFISKPVSSINGLITVPGDKSISHRSIIFGSIATGTTKVSGFLDGEDCLATLKAFQSMGVAIEGPFNRQLLIHGVGKYGLKKPEKTIDCGNSGTSMRLLAGLLAAQNFDSQLSGDESLLRRPMMRIGKPLTLMGADICTQDGKPPLRITGGKTLTGIDYVMPEASAQVKSCILLAGLYAKGQTRITETGVSRDHTERMLRTFGYPLTSTSRDLSVESMDLSGSLDPTYRQRDIDIVDCYQTLTIDPNGECKATNIKVPGDISSAAFFIVAASIIPGSDITIRNVGINPTRTGIIEILQAMGANISFSNQQHFGEEPVADIRIQSAPLKGIVIDPALVPLAIDEFPIIFIAAACAQGETHLHGAKELRLKESDRIGAMVDGLVALGIQAQGFEDGVIIQGGTLKSGKVDSRGDHRIAMSFAIAGAVANGSVHISNCANVATSFPEFAQTANSLNLHVEEVNENVR